MSRFLRNFIPNIILIAYVFLSAFLFVFSFVAISDYTTLGNDALMIILIAGFILYTLSFLIFFIVFTRIYTRKYGKWEEWDWGTGGLP